MYLPVRFWGRVTWDIISPAVTAAHFKASASKSLQSRKKDDGAADFGMESSNLVVVSISQLPPSFKDLGVEQGPATIGCKDG